MGLEKKKLFIVCICLDSDLPRGTSGIIFLSLFVLYLDFDNRTNLTRKSQKGNPIATDTDKTNPTSNGAVFGSVSASLLATAPLYLCENRISWKNRETRHR